MPRRARELSDIGIYHVTFRGIGGMDIFADNQDRHKMLDRMEMAMEEDEYVLYSYCLMSNHVHLLIKANDQLSRIVKRICGPYAQFFNWKYGRTGHLFQDRFHSQIVDNETYFKVCARYIHLNPVTAGLVTSPQGYPWSSYRDYLRPGKASNLVQRDYLYSLFMPDRHEAAMALATFTNSDDSNNDFKFLEPGEAREMQVKRIEEILSAHGLSILTFSRAPQETKRQVLGEIVQAVDISGRELEKLLGIARQVVYAVRRKLTTGNRP
jgi:putative transposase